MSEQVYSENRDGIALITLNRPPGNALTLHVRLNLANALGSAVDDPEIVGIVLTGAGQGFCAGADLAEFNAPISFPWVSDLCDQIENAPKPVVVALHGMTIGAGFELALSAHARVAHQQTLLALPDVTLGMIPGAGATQRLPRLLGAQRALELMLTGQTLQATDPRLKRVFSKVTPDAPLKTAIEFARSLAKVGQWRRTCDEDTGFSDPEGYQAIVSQVAEQLPTKEGAEADLLRCIEAAQLLPFPQGLAFERSVFEERLSAPETRGPRHYLTAERAAQLPRFPVTGVPVAIQRVALLGTGDVLGELATVFLDAGLGVDLAMPEKGVAHALRQQVERFYQTGQARGLVKPEQVRDRMTRLSEGAGLSGLAEADLIVDTSQAAVKDPPVLKSGAIWAVTRPGFDPAQRSAACGAKGRGVLLHPYRPATAVPVLEVVFPKDIDGGVESALLSLFNRLGRSLIRTAPPAGQLGGRMSARLYCAAEALVHHGATPYTVDHAACTLGFAHGPFELMDRDGLDRVADRLDRFRRRHDWPETDAGLLTDLVLQGRTGRKAGRGVYLYSSGKVAENPRLADSRSNAGPAATFSELQLGTALQGALVNEAAALLRENVVERASDIDLVMVRGFDFDRAKGGPLLQADLKGLFSLYKAMQDFAKLSPIWHPDPLIEDMVKNGEGFFGRSIG